VRGGSLSFFFLMFQTTFMPQSGASVVALRSSVKRLPINIVLMNEAGGCVASQAGMCLHIAVSVTP
jgi:peptidyl-tRNA hydrolase